MQRKIKYQLLILALFLGNIALSYTQEITALNTFNKIESYYKTVDVLDIEMEYKMFRGYTGTNLTESYKGTMYRKEGVTRIEILGSEIIDLPDAKLIVNKEAKTIAYNKKSFEKTQNSPVDISMFLKFYKEASTKISGHIIIHEMVLKEGIQISIPYRKIIIHVNKNNYQIEKQELYLSTKVPFVDKNGKEVSDLARMEIKFRKNPNPLKKVPELKDYVRIDSNKKVHLSQNYMAYKIIDQTNS
ncbi:hypothetical protein Q4Q35_19505 [Flavivirga aquimarina]|uniref:Outer membrane lipoprotein-sorting protein n=1 Tax=Flavivirga aquimarina TaxID=2027862 RepID=A0ABT8WG53_9FLAO|nr:hypothetical protein [Flavivirga aquimarina]MDO5971994.1 hypothetical protein [Flavivirga aquimarina]